MRRTLWRAVRLILLLSLVASLVSGCLEGGCSPGDREDIQARQDEEYRQEVAATFAFTMTNPRVVSKHPPGAFIVPIAVFPNVLVAGLFGFTRRDFFDAEPEATGPVRVQF